MVPAPLGLNHRPSPSLINTQRKRVPRCCCLSAASERDVNVSATRASSVSACVHTTVLIIMRVFRTERRCANAQTCVCLGVPSCLHVFMCICVCDFCGEIISCNVHWPDSLPVLGFFRCINILDESPGGTGSLRKHNCHESVHILCTPGLIISTENLARTVF